ncbi:hypothetical protein [Sulfobacillus thermosulfidooxidans]|uniref:hypothetical protein n=1 Tax=Sulfobacillus thermosulfidooxidans TaxID=28034 RepID=UPI0002EB61AE|nr:hypothetical protein [Sulfobacillus thermosulfidooxidans]
MFADINLWNPHSGLPMSIIIVTAFLLGMVHGITPDEHTWPITFSYAIGAYSTRGGLLAGLSFSLAFTVQRAIASELAYLALAKWMENPRIDAVVYIIVGIAMFFAGKYIRSQGRVFHIHGLKSHHHENFEPMRSIPPQMAMLHGFLAGWGFGAFAIIIYTVLAPGMHSAWWGWVPGAFFGLGTMTIQASAGALFGHWMSRARIPADMAKSVAQSTASATLLYGGIAFVLAGSLSLMFPALQNVAWITPIHVHNLHTLGIGFILVAFTVLVVGLGSLVRAMRKAQRLAAKRY